MDADVGGLGFMSMAACAKSFRGHDRDEEADSEEESAGDGPLIDPGGEDSQDEEHHMMEL